MNGGRKFDIIILDMLMKPLNGIETARLIRKYDSEVPILIVTGTVEYAMDGYQVNAYRYILKPVDKAYFFTGSTDYFDINSQVTE